MKKTHLPPKLSRRQRIQNDEEEFTSPKKGVENDDGEDIYSPKTKKYAFVTNMIKAIADREAELSYSGSRLGLEKNQGGRQLTRQKRIEIDEELFHSPEKEEFVFITRLYKESDERKALAAKKQKLMMKLFTPEKESTVSCCTRRCFERFDKTCVRARKSLILEMNQKDRKYELSRMLNTRTKKFSFNDEEVCSTFLEQAFGFSKYLQARVKGMLGTIRLQHPHSNVYKRK